MKLPFKIDFRQIGALLWKDVLVRIRKPWMSLVQYLWPCIIFFSMLILRNRFQPTELDECQFPTRQLYSHNQLIPFFQSYLCAIENKCKSVNEYEEIQNYEQTAAGPALNIIQIFLNEYDLYDAIIELPEEQNLITAIATIARSPFFKTIESHAIKLMDRVPEIREAIGNDFSVKEIFSDSSMLMRVGNVLCGHPFPRNNNIRFIQKIIESQDFNGADQAELDVMPTQYCKQLYIDVTSSNYGKITWNYVKPIIQGKILFGPENDKNWEIIKYSNGTFHDVYRLQNFVSAVNKTIKLAKYNSEFRKKILNLIELAKTPLVQSIAGDQLDINQLESVVDMIMNDTSVENTVETVANLLQCFSVDRFIPVNSTKDLQDVAYDLSHNKLFYAGIYFKNDSIDNENEVSYTIRMDVDNSPVTIENRNKFWYPGPEGNFEFDLRYHRGFVQTQHAIDTGIIKYHAKHNKIVERNETVEEVKEKDPFDFDFEDDDDFDNSNEDLSTDLPQNDQPQNDQSLTDEDDENKDIDIDTTTVIPKTSTVITTISSIISENDTDSSESSGTEPNILELIKETFNVSDPILEFPNGSNVGDIAELLKLHSESSGLFDSGEVKNRTKRQINNLLDLFLGERKQVYMDKFDVDDVQVYTKQFPYPKYIRDDYKTGVYLGQVIQIAYFLALIVSVAMSVHHRIWMKESGNSTLMRIMGLEKSSENIAWVITTFIEFIIVFILGTTVLYSCNVLVYTSKIFLYTFLVLFILCLISFCYMISTLFTSASIGSVSAVILFLITFLPYISLVSLGATLSFIGKFIANLFFSTAFCYGWRYIFRSELQVHSLQFSNGFIGNLTENEFKFSFMMLVIDFFLYLIIGYLYDRYKNDDYKFHEVNRMDLDTQTGAILQNVTKVYQHDRPPAINNVSLIIKKNFITALLGRNGAGKSTIIKMLTGQTLPSGGNLFLPQIYDLITGNNKQEKLGLCPQNNVLIPSLTAKEHLQLYARIKSRGNNNEEVERILELLNLGKFESYKSQELSGGYKRRLCIANAFLCSPNLVILDEPCSSVDTKARKNIWELIEMLKKGRAVVLATHYLDEAEHLSDSVIMLNKGIIVAENSPESLRNQFTKKFSLKILMSTDGGSLENTKQKIKDILDENLKVYECEESTPFEFIFNINYRDDQENHINFTSILKSLEELQKDKKILSFKVISKNLQDLFGKLSSESDHTTENGVKAEEIHYSVEEKFPELEIKTPNHFKLMKNLLWKRFNHFKRNYRALLCILVLPTIFEITAMGFMKLRPPGEHEKDLWFSKNLYEGSKEFYSYQSLAENTSEYSMETYNLLTEHCNNQCELFNSSRNAFYWILNTTDDYILNRYGGVVTNDTRQSVWYNNKGYHSMTTYLNVLNNKLLAAEMSDSSYTIKTSNHPMLLGEKDLGISSVLQQVADAGIALILLLAFSLVVAGSSVYIVSERVSGEKLQQKLAGIDYKIYWGVSFLWDFSIYLVALILCVIVFEIFGIPIYVARDNLPGLIILFSLYGFATISGVHLFEKIFSEPSFANMSIFCLNVVIALTTLTVILIIDILGESEESDRIRHILNRAFLIFPQHALGDALIEICKNHIQADIFIRFYINSYKSPVTSDLLMPHFLSLFFFGLIFLFINFLIESDHYTHTYDKLFNKKAHKKINEELKIISIQNSLKKNGKLDQYTQDCILKVENLSKSYSSKREKAVDNVSFDVIRGECFGLLGTNGAGKSTIFSILSGQLGKYTGSIEFFDNNGISYCPQINPVDSLLTVDEVMYFYMRLKSIRNENQILSYLLKFYNLEPYRNVLVKDLSGGNRRKLVVAVTCLGKTRLVFMDEPTSDMDPVTRAIVYKSINLLLNDHRSIILTSHTISEIEKICSRIAVLRDGKLITIGTPEKLKSLYGNYYGITLFFDKIQSLTIEREVKEYFPSAQNILLHNYSIEFSLEIKNLNNEETALNTEGILLSELFNKLYQFTSSRNLLYTVTECQLDQAFENILESKENAYCNSGFIQNESNFS